MAFSLPRPWKNTDLNYGMIAIILHWTMAVLFIGAYVAVYYRHWFTESKTPENMMALHLHLSFGVTAIVFMVLRIIYKLTSKPLPEPPGKKWEHRASKYAHWLLYAVIIYMPLTGFLGTGLGADWFFLFKLPQIKELGIYHIVVEGWMGLTWDEFEEPMDFLHKKSGAYFVWVLVGVHAAAALYHHIVKKDDVLVRMLPIRR